MSSPGKGFCSAPKVVHPSSGTAAIVNHVTVLNRFPNMFKFVFQQLSMFIVFYFEYLGISLSLALYPLIAVFLSLRSPVWP